MGNVLKQNSVIERDRRKNIQKTGEKVQRVLVSLVLSQISVPEEGRSIELTCLEGFPGLSLSTLYPRNLE